MTVYNVYHPDGWLMCNMRDATRTTNLPGSGRWGERLPVFIPCGDDGTLSHAGAVAILRRAAEAEAEPLRGMMLERAAAIERRHAGEEGGMRELSLFTGAGGGVLGTHLLGWTPVGYVEFNDYCQRIIAQRIKDGYIPNAPIFSDVRAFISEGFAASYTGLVDVITAGFPCQPFSAAGKRAGEDDPRNMWPATIECIRVVRPRYAFLENVPGLLSSGYFGTILGDLAESGYDARWRILSAAELGAPHKRDRLWIVGHTSGAGLAQWPGERGDSRPEQSPAVGASGACGGWWATEPDVGRVADELAARVDRLKAIGNGQVPAVVAAAWRLLTAHQPGLW